MDLKELGHRAKSGPLHWFFTNGLGGSSGATIRYDLEFDEETRKFSATVRHRQNSFTSWEAATPLNEAIVNQLRAQLPPSEIAECTAAAIRAKRDADADA